MPIFDGQLSAIAAELEGLDPEECQIQVGRQGKQGEETGLQPNEGDLFVGTAV